MATLNQESFVSLGVFGAGSAVKLEITAGSASSVTAIELHARNSASQPYVEIADAATWRYGSPALVLGYTKSDGTSPADKLAAGVKLTANLDLNHYLEFDVRVLGTGTATATVVNGTGLPVSRVSAGGSAGARVVPSRVMFLGSSSFARGAAPPNLPKYDPVYVLYGGTGTLNTHGQFSQRGYMSGAAQRLAGGKIDFDASDNTMQWTAPGDTPGPKVPVVPERMFYTLPSGTPGNEFFGDFIPRNKPLVNATVTYLQPTNERFLYNNVSPWGIPGVIQTLLGRPFDESYSYAVGASTLADFVAAMPEWEGVATDLTFIYVGTNDITVLADVKPALDNMERLIVARKGSGSEVVVGTGFPANARTENHNKAIAEFNIGLRRLASLHGVRLADAWPYTATATGTWAAGLFADDLHANGSGATVIASKAFVPAARDLVPADYPMVLSTVPYSATTAPNGNLVVNPGMTGTGGTAGNARIVGDIPTNWTVTHSVGSTITSTVKAPDSASPKPLSDGRVGNYLSIVSSNANPGAINGESVRVYLLPAGAGISAGFAAGDLVYYEGEFTLSGVGIVGIEAAMSVLSTTPTIRVYGITPGTGATAPAVGDVVNRTYKFKTNPVRIPAGVTGLNVAIMVTHAIGGSSTLDIVPNLTVRKVTE